jgi:hypothetical protein
MSRVRKILKMNPPLIPTISFTVPSYCWPVGLSLLEAADRLSLHIHDYSQQFRVISLSCYSLSLSDRDKESMILIRQNSMNLGSLWEVAQSRRFHCMHMLILRLCVPEFRTRFSFWTGIHQLVREVLGNNMGCLSRLDLSQIDGWHELDWKQSDFPHFSPFSFQGLLKVLDQDVFQMVNDFH